MSEKPTQAERVGHLPTLIGLQSLPPKGVTQWDKAAVTIRRLPGYLATITLPHDAKIVAAEGVPNKYLDVAKFH
jgi:hypothetical protein